MSSEQLSSTQPLVAPEARRQERNARLTLLALIIPAILLTILFLYYPLVFIFRMSFTLADSFLSPSGPIFHSRKLSSDDGPISIQRMGDH
jgi:hypothetical protein